MSGSESPGVDSTPPSAIPSPPLLPDGTAEPRAPDNGYRALFDSIDQGFCVIKMLFDGAGKACDYRFVEVNPAFERHTGLKARTAVGRTARELVPQLEEHWFEIYGRVALTGAPKRFEMPAQNMGDATSMSAPFARGSRKSTAWPSSSVTSPRGGEWSAGLPKRRVFWT